MGLQLRLRQSLASIILEHMINDEVDEESYEDPSRLDSVFSFLISSGGH